MLIKLPREQLTELVAQKSDLPLTPLAVAALLESFGLRDRVILTVMGVTTCLIWLPKFMAGFV